MSRLKTGIRLSEKNSLCCLETKRGKKKAPLPRPDFFLKNFWGESMAGAGVPCRGFPGDEKV